MSYQVFNVQELDQGKIVKVTISRPKKLNAMNRAFFKELSEIFTSINNKQNARVVLLAGEGRMFTAGIDLHDFPNFFPFDFNEQDKARLSRKLYDIIIYLQKCVLSIVQCRVPVIAGIHNKCYGGGIDLTSMCDIRYCTSDASFSITQIDIGMASDIGTLQLFPNLVGNQSTFRELAMTGRFMDAKQAKKIGFISKVLPSKKQLDDELMLTAKAIASKSPVGIYTLKQIMKRELYKKVQDNLQYIARTNSSMLMTKDMNQAISSILQKAKPQFSKL